MRSLFALLCVAALAFAWGVADPVDVGKAEVVVAVVEASDQEATWVWEIEPVFSVAVSAAVDVHLVNYPNPFNDIAIVPDEVRALLEEGGRLLRYSEPQSALIDATSARNREPGHWLRC